MIEVIVFLIISFCGIMTGVYIGKILEKCKHEYEHHFIPFADQPFKDDDRCCIEGEHVYKCINCGEIVKYSSIDGKNIKTGL